MNNSPVKKTSMVGTREIDTKPANMEKDDVYKTNTFFWDTTGNEVLGATALPSYGAFTSEEKCQLFGDVSGKKLLEIGCGSGESLKYFGKHNPAELWGMDISENQISKANHLLTEHGVSAKFVCSPMEEDCGIPESILNFV